MPKNLKIKKSNKHNKQMNMLIDRSAKNPKVSETKILDVLAYCKAKRVQYIPNTIERR